MTGGTLAGSGGTLMRVAGDDAGFNETTLDAIMAGRCPVRLLKSDVDGFDYDVIESAEAVIALSWPILFFETLLRHDFQRQGFERIIADLAARGYRNWVVFDNFGEVMFTTRVDAEIIALLGYLWRQECGLATRTVHYFDLLACTDADRSLIDRVISGYLGE